jgi:hypothetical protein
MHNLTSGPISTAHFTNLFQQSLSVCASLIVARQRFDNNLATLTRQRIDKTIIAAIDKWFDVSFPIIVRQKRKI